ncbi:hypothetical protein SDC9_186828 [bioreactor metagenome]|uniref:Uncharacterized protein n=1 Tax=bioreactor metagenome TaxID=1076179 RepID=A0A645HKL9_9ZZZZ
MALILERGDEHALLLGRRTPEHRIRFGRVRKLFITEHARVDIILRARYARRVRGFGHRHGIVARYELERHAFICKVFKRLFRAGAHRIFKRDHRNRRGVLKRLRGVVHTRQKNDAPAAFKVRFARFAHAFIIFAQYDLRRAERVRFAALKRGGAPLARG